ncbi:hypothetical protein KQI82_01860 [Oscillibacter sp. MSJ-2]|uniref:Uncharacterized protein n=1 Tax=Dysosmobacter acutus TaxID=2841504 RepID=A0ABS6F5X8_9FIRM|nr:hypothetical protein [Dysosmobacter acutus]MBU5625680.1 hypothetical protein [Dysosmobacter acutus]
MKNSYIFTRSALRAIAPELSAEQESAVIELYLTASYHFKNRMIELESENEELKERVAHLIKRIYGEGDA